MLEGKFAFSSDSVQYIKRLTNRGCVFYALHKLEAWVQLLSAEMILCPSISAQTRAEARLQENKQCSQIAFLYVCNML